MNKIELIRLKKSRLYSQLFFKNKTVNERERVIDYEQSDIARSAQI